MTRSLQCHRSGRALPWVAALWALLASATASAATSWDGNRWFQVEVSIFSNEFTEDESSERWSPDRLALTYPRRLRRLDTLANLFVIPDLEARLRPEPTVQAPDTAPLDPLEQRLLNTGPRAPGRLLEFRLPDLQRDAFVQLPTALSDFQQTNRALERSPENRLLFHGLWRQPVLTTDQATALLIEGGRRFGDQHELQGSLTIRFNAGQDRVVIDSNLWLVDYTQATTGDSPWRIPPIPAALRNFPVATAVDVASEGDYGIRRIVQFQQSRDMRSNEFHYLDHPVMGLVVSVKPYDLPPPDLSVDLPLLPGNDQ